MSSSDLESQPPQPALDLARSHRQDFDHDPGDDELARFVDPDASVVAPLRVVETPQEIRVDLCPSPLWFVALCLALPLVAVVWYWRGDAPQGVRVGAVAGGFLISLAFFAMVIFLNRYKRALGPFCVVDLANTRLELPRLGLSLSKPQIVRFVEFRGWRDTSPESAPDTDREWSRELSVIVKNDQESFSRYQVVIGEGWPVSRFGKRLAVFFAVELVNVKG